MYAKPNKDFYSRIAAFACVFLAVLSFSCVAPERVRFGADPGESIVSAKASAARLEAVNAIAGRAVEYATVEVERIRQSLLDSVGGIDGAIEALASYDRFVKELIERIRELERASGSGAGEDKVQE